MEINLQETASLTEIVWTIPCIVALFISGYISWRFLNNLLYYFSKGIDGIRRLASWLLVIMSAGFTLIIFFYVLAGLISMLTPPVGNSSNSDVSFTGILVTAALISSAVVADTVQIASFVIFNRIVNYNEPENDSIDPPTVTVTVGQ